MRNHISELLEHYNSIAYELTTDLRKSAEGLDFVFIQLTCINNDFMNFHYLIEHDRLQIWDYIARKIYTYNNFSKLADEAYYFQQMTVLDHIGFEPYEVRQLMEVLNRIKEEHETKST